MKKQKSQTNGTKTNRLIFALVALVIVGGMAIISANPRILYAWYYSDKRFYKSTDEGRSWSNPKAQGLSNVIALATDPNDEQVVWAATQRGLYRSTDGGESFELMSFGGTPVITVAVDPQNPQVLYVSLESGLQKTTDGGQNWESIGFV